MPQKPSFGKRKVDPSAAVTQPSQTAASHVGVKRSAERRAYWSPCTLRSMECREYEQPMVREVIILDASETGARIRSRSKSDLPKYINVRSSRIGLHRRARVIWQNEFDAGIAFVDAS